jgi:DNA replication protein DnaC
MNTDQLLKWANDLVFAKTGQYLDSLQTSILQGSLEGLKYEEIAKNSHRSKSHVKNVASELWQSLSDTLEEDVDKINIRSTLQRKAISHIYNIGECAKILIGNINSNYINMCEEKEQNLPSFISSIQKTNQFPIIDLTQAPELSCNYGRTLELSRLKEWIKKQTRLITIYGLSGIGKTALTIKLIEEIKTEFDYIIYRSLDNSSQLINLKDDLKQFFTQSQSSLLPDIIDYLKSYRCLIILDDLQTIFQTNELASKYLKDYENYSKFFKQIVTTSHQSCFILLSWEQPRECVTLKSDKIQTLYLKGLESQAEEILQEYGLKNQEKWSDLITLYQSHPNWLNIISLTILELFDGEVSLFLEQMQDEIYLGDIECLIESHLQRLSETEKKVIHWLSNQTETVKTSLKPTNLDLSPSEFLTTLQSLIRRCLVDKIQLDNQSYFQLNAVFKAYLKRNLNDL